MNLQEFCFSSSLSILVDIILAVPSIEY